MSRTEVWNSRTEWKRVRNDLTNQHNLFVEVLKILRSHDDAIADLRVRLLPPEQTNAVDSSEDRKDKPLEPFGSLGEYIEPLQDVPAVGGNEAANEGYAQNQ